MGIKDKASFILIISLGAIVIGLIILCGVLWNKPNNELLKYKEQQAKENIRIIDSIEKERDIRIEFLTDSFNNIIIQAIEQNNSADKRKTIIIHDKHKMNEEINNTYTLNSLQQVELFNRESDSYNPPR